VCRQRHRQEAVVRQNGMQRSVVGALFQTNSYQHSRSDKSFIDHLDMTEFVAERPAIKEVREQFVITD